MIGEFLGRPSKIVIKKDDSQFIMTEAFIPFRSIVFPLAIIIIFLKPFIEGAIANPFNDLFIFLGIAYIIIVIHTLCSLFIRRIIIFDNVSRKLSEKHNIIYKSTEVRYDEIDSIVISTHFYRGGPKTGHIITIDPFGEFYDVVISYKREKKQQPYICVNIFKNHKKALIFARKISNATGKPIKDICEQRRKSIAYILGR